MLSYFLKCKKNIENINPRVSKTSNGKTTILSKCAICGRKKSRFIKRQEASGILSSLGLKTPLTHISSASYICDMHVYALFKPYFSVKLAGFCFLIVKHTLNILFI